MYFVLQGKVAILIPNNNHKQLPSLNSPNNKRSNSNNFNDSPRSGSGGNTVGMTDPGADIVNTRNLSNVDSNSKSNAADNKTNSSNSGKNSSSNFGNKKPSNEIENI